MTDRTRIDVVRAAFEAYFRGDEPAMLELIDPAIVVTQFREQPDVRPYHGHEGLRQVVEEWTGTWDDYSIELLDMREIGEHVVVSLHLCTVRDGRVVRWQMFSSEEQALAALD